VIGAAPSYSVAEITVNAVPEPSGFVLAVLGICLALVLRRKRVSGAAH